MANSKVNKIKNKNQKTDVDVFAAEVETLVNKYAHVKDISIVGEPSHTENGFYLLFIKRDEKLGANRLQITTFGQNISSSDLMDSMESALGQLTSANNKPENLA